MNNFILEAEQKLEAEKQLAEQLLLEKYLKMVGVAKHDFSNSFRKHLNIATGLSMDTDLTTNRIFNPSETKIARTLIDELKGDKDILYIIRSRSSSDEEKKKAEEEPKPEVKESLAAMFEKKIAPEEKAEEKKPAPKSEKDTDEEEFKKARDFAADGHSKSGDISDGDAEGVIDNTELQHFFILTNIVRLGKRIAPEMQTPPAMHLMMVSNLEGTEDKPLKVEVVNATLSVLVELLKKNTSTVNFVYKLLAKPEHTQHLKINLDVDTSEDNGELQKDSDVNDSDDATADELETDGADQPKEVADDGETAPEEESEKAESEDEESEEDADDEDEEATKEPKKKASQSSQIFQKMEGLELGSKYKLKEDVGYMKDGTFHIDMRNGAIVELTDLMNEENSVVKVKHIASRQEITIDGKSLTPIKVGG